MSEYYVCKAKVFDKECIIDALKDIGIPEIAITQYDAAQILKGHRQATSAEIVISRNHVGTSHDIGFKSNADGGYNLVIYDGDIWGKYGQKLVAKADRGTGEFLEHYAKNVILKQAKRKY